MGKVEKIVEESTKVYISRIMQKLAFSVKNTTKQQKQKNKEQSKNELEFHNSLNRKAVLSILYCLVNRLITLFNEEGEVNMEAMLKNETNVNVLEFASKLSKVMGNYRLKKT